MLRGLLVALLLANALFFGWARGWFAGIALPPERQQREPERLQAQVRPGLIELVSPAAASAAVAATRRVCLEAGPLDAAGLAATENAMLSAGLPADAWIRQPDAASDGQRIRVEQADASVSATLQALSPDLIPAAFAICSAR